MLTKKGNKPKITERKKLVKQADTAVSEYIRTKIPYCVCCKSTQNLTAGHLITRSKYSVRWDERNIFTQCSGCNLSHEYNPHPFTLWFVKKFGQDKYEKLVKDSNEIRKFTNNDLRKIIEDYQIKLSLHNFEAKKPRLYPNPFD